LGAATTADLTVRWPNGNVETFARVAANELIVIREGAGIVDRIKFPKRD
jgi:hypothetical protein